MRMANSRYYNFPKPASWLGRTVEISPQKPSDKDMEARLLSRQGRQVTTSEG